MVNPKASAKLLHFRTLTFRFLPFPLKIAEYFRLLFHFSLFFLAYSNNKLYLCTRNQTKRNMSKIKTDVLHVQGIDVGIYSEDYRNEYISLTDIARYRNSEDPRFAIQNWMRNRNTIEFLGLWESLHNPDFNRVQFDTFRVEAGLNLFGMTAAQWRSLNPGKKGNIRDYASLQQLLVLANMESYNALLIGQKISQPDRLQALRTMAIKQLQTLSSLDITGLPQLPGK